MDTDRRTDEQIIKQEAVLSDMFASKEELKQFKKQSTKELIERLQKIAMEKKTKND